MRKVIIAGLAVRKHIRRFLLEQDVDFIEERGWIESEFYCKCSDEKFNMILSSIDKWQRELDKK